MLLPDTNVWLALAFDSHAHHPVAKSWFDGLSSEQYLFCRMTQQGFLRLASNPRVFGQHAVTLSEAWQLYDLFLSDPRVTFADERVGVEDHWRRFTQNPTFSPHVWNDAFLAAFALAGNLKLITFDKGFSQYPSVPCTILS